MGNPQLALNYSSRAPGHFLGRDGAVWHTGDYSLRQPGDLWRRGESGRHPLRKDDQLCLNGSRLRLVFRDTLYRWRRVSNGYCHVYPELFIPTRVYRTP